MDESILKIYEEAKNCAKCYGEIPIHVPLPDEKNGGVYSKVLFICERPGRKGTRSGYVSFNNEDPTAKTFKKLFSSINIKRKNIFITNSALCHPLIDNYKDIKPTQLEITNCVYYLQQIIDVTQPKIIVTLGNTALKTVKKLFPDNRDLMKFKLKENIGKLIREKNIMIYPLYHTSIRAQLKRPFQQQINDWNQIHYFLRIINTS